MCRPIECSLTRRTIARSPRRLTADAELCTCCSMIKLARPLRRLHRKALHNHNPKALRHHNPKASRHHHPSPLPKASRRLRALRASRPLSLNLLNLINLLLPLPRGHWGCLHSALAHCRDRCFRAFKAIGRDHAVNVPPGISQGLRAVRRPRRATATRSAPTRATRPTGRIACATSRCAPSRSTCPTRCTTSCTKTS